MSDFVTVQEPVVKNPIVSVPNAMFSESELLSMYHLQRKLSENVVINNASLVSSINSSIDLLKRALKGVYECREWHDNNGVCKNKTCDGGLHLV